LKLAVIFRGPLRSNPSSVLDNSKFLLDQLINTGHEVHSYLATWTYHKDYHVSDLDLKYYDNVIALAEPTEDHIRRYITRRDFDGLHATVPNVYKMYYQIKSTIEIILGAGGYDRIVNSRTDVHVDFGEHMKNWIEPYAFMRPIPIRGDVLDDNGICDWINVAPPDVMYAAYNYGNQRDLSFLIDHAPTPEHILLHMLESRKINHQGSLIGDLWLDPNRYN